MRGAALLLVSIVALSACATYSPVKNPQTGEVVAVCRGAMTPGWGIIGWIQTGLYAGALYADHKRCVEEARRKGYVVTRGGCVSPPTDGGGMGLRESQFRS